MTISTRTTPPSMAWQSLINLNLYSTSTARLAGLARQLLDSLHLYRVVISLPLYHRLNLLTPRFMNQRGIPLPTSTGHSKKAEKQVVRERQILIPELCDIHLCSASMWRKLVCLPSILYRMNTLLTSMELLSRSVLLCYFIICSSPSPSPSFSQKSVFFHCT